MPTTFKDYYAVLGVPRTASEKEIHSAFRKRARRHHPDVNPNDKGAEDRFKEINEAHEVLGDPDKRKKYDELGPRWQEYEAWERAGKPGPNPFTGGGPQTQTEYRTVSPEELEELFGDSAPFSDFFQTFFGGSNSGGAARFGGQATRSRGRTRAVAPQRGGDVEGEADITLEEAVRGTTRTVELATGSAPSRRVELRIPGGIRDGARIRAAGQGSAGAAGGPSGDLYVRIRVRPDHRFARHGDDLTVKVPVPLDIALLGGAVQVPTPRGTQVELSIPAGTQNGAKLRLRGQGMPKLRGEGAGDLIASVDVRLPVPAPAELRHWAEQQRNAASSG
jgi:DnaJ-class molecular chaperone